MPKNQILNYLSNPEEMEKLYRKDKKAFARDFYDIYPQIAYNQLAQFWKARLTEDIKPPAPKVSLKKNDLLSLLIAGVVSALLIKIPELLPDDPASFRFYLRNTGSIVALGIILYTILSSGAIASRKSLITLAAFLVPVLFVNLLPFREDSQSLVLSCIHLPLWLWFVYGMVHIGYDLKSHEKRIAYLRYNGDLVILSTLIYIAGLILTGITLGLFQVIDVDISTFYMEYVVLCGFVAVPVVSAFLIRNYPDITHRLAPAIASIFVPLVLITLVAYLIAIPVSGINLYQNRIFLFVFNVLLVGVMAIIIFTLTDLASQKRQKLRQWMLFAMMFLTLVIDLIALSAIAFRLNEYGFSPNRTVVLVSNVLIFGHILYILIAFIQVIFRKGEIKRVEKAISVWLPLYALWSLVVVFLFPVIFGMQ